MEIDYNNENIVFVYFGHNGTGNLITRLLSLSAECADLDPGNIYESLFVFNKDARGILLDEGHYDLKHRLGLSRNAHTGKNWFNTNIGKFPFNNDRHYGNNIEYIQRVMKRFMRKYKTQRLLDAQTHRKIILIPTHYPIGSKVFPNSRFITVRNTQSVALIGRNFSEKNFADFNSFTKAQFKERLFRNIKSNLGHPGQERTLFNEGVDVINTSRNTFIDLKDILTKNYQAYLQICSFLNITPIGEYTFNRFINEYIRLQFVRPPRKSLWEIQPDFCKAHLNVTHNKEIIFNTIKPLLEEIVGNEWLVENRVLIDYNTKFSDDLSFDATDEAIVILMIKMQLEIKLPFEDNWFETINDLVDYLDTHFQTTFKGIMPL